MEGWRSQIQPAKYFLIWRHLYPWGKWALLLSLVLLSELLPQGLQSSVEMVIGKRIPKIISNAWFFYVMFKDSQDQYPSIQAKTCKWVDITPFLLVAKPGVSLYSKQNPNFSTMNMCFLYIIFYPQSNHNSIILSTPPTQQPNIMTGLKL